MGHQVMQELPRRIAIAVFVTQPGRISANWRRNRIFWRRNRILGPLQRTVVSLCLTTRHVCSPLKTPATYALPSPFRHSASAQFLLDLSPAEAASPTTRSSVEAPSTHTPLVTIMTDCSRSGWTSPLLNVAAPDRSG